MILKTKNLQVTAVAHQVGTYFFVEDLVYSQQTGIVARDGGAKSGELTIGVETGSTYNWQPVTA